MAAHLLIQDGSPQWWLSPDIWAVPGSDPNGAPGAPIAGTPTYLWARVANTGSSAAPGTRVDFYWANPSAQMAIGVATPVGSAFVDLAPGDVREVLCLVPWVPVIVNGGHECVVAVAHKSGDTNPIPDPLPNGFALDPPAHEQIAQLNLSVIQVSPFALNLPLTVSAIGRADKNVVVALEMGGELNERTLTNLGLRGVRPARRASVKASLSRVQGCSDEKGHEGTSRLEMKVARGTSAAVFVTLQTRDVPRGEYQLVHVVERSGKVLLGGVTYLIVNTEDGKSASRNKELPQ